MKNQYFGDNRDLFKYDLILQIIKKGNLVNHFTFIPMLTENDDSKQGGVTNRERAKAGTLNIELMNFLDECIAENKRNIKQLKSYFKAKALSMSIYKDDEHFSHENRREYFNEIVTKLLPRSLVLVDPDKGLQIKKSSKEHILYCEAKMLYDRMDRNSVLMIFQYFPRIRTQDYIQEYFCQRSEKLREVTGSLPIYIDDNEIRFFFLDKDKSIRDSLCKILKDYKNTYPKLTLLNMATGD